MNAYEQKKQAKLERLRARVERLKGESLSRYNRFKSIFDMIPMGQPILVGHHSERGHRRDIARMNTNMRKSIEADRAAKKAESSIAAIESRRSIDSDNPEAIRLLEEKIQKIEKNRDRMKAANKAIKQKDLQAFLALDFTELHWQKLNTPDFAGRIGFPDYALTNSGAEVRRLKKRIDALRSISDSFVEYSIGSIEVKLVEGQIQVHFPNKPSEEVRTRLKSAPISLKWSSYSTAWVRKYTPSCGAYFQQELKKLLTGISEATA